MKKAKYNKIKQEILQNKFLIDCIDLVSRHISNGDLEFMKHEENKKKEILDKIEILEKSISNVRIK